MKSFAFSYKRHRFQQQVISNALRLNFRFPLSFRLVEDNATGEGTGRTLLCEGDQRS
ncbi:hypothetical protein VH564_21255 [Rhizobium sp. HT1-10]